MSSCCVSNVVVATGRWLTITPRKSWILAEKGPELDSLSFTRYIRPSLNDLVFFRGKKVGEGGRRALASLPPRRCHPPNSAGAFSRPGLS